MNSGQSPSKSGGKLLDLLSQGSRRSRPSGVTGLANRIRSYVERGYIRPAREHGRGEITIRAGDIHKDMGLVSRMPSVCNVLRSGKFQREFGVELVSQTGPYHGANAYFRFRILDGEPGIAQSEHQSAPARPPMAVSPSDYVRYASEHTVVLVSCVGQKQTKPVEAKDLYLSDWFLKARRFAEGVGVPWLILSAEHGLVGPGDVIAPYEKTLNTMPVQERREWADKVFTQLTSAVPDLRHVIVLAGSRYREFLVDRLRARGVTVDVPMEGLRIGEQLSWLSQNARHG